MITEVQRAGDVVLQKVTHPKTGEVLRYQYGKPGDASSIIHVQSLDEGRKALPVTIIVDRSETGVVRKITQGGKARYEYDAGNGFVEVSTLAEARKAIGK